MRGLVIGRTRSTSRQSSRPRKMPAIGDHQARKLLEAPEEDTIKIKRDRAIL